MESCWNFDISFTGTISSLLVECDQKMMERFRFMTRRGKPIRRFIGKVFRLPNVELAECRPAGTVWFFSGDTLVQALDHPALPDKLAYLIFCFMDASNAGYSRVIRWALAIFPAFERLVVDPIRPMDDDEYLISY